MEKKLYLLTSPGCCVLVICGLDILGWVVQYIPGPCPGPPGLRQFAPVICVSLAVNVSISQRLGVTC